MYTVYKHIFPNGKVYIGITSLKPIERWKNGRGYHKEQTRIYYAIKKYGWENVQHEILYENLTKEQAEKKEIELISFHKSNNINYGYNIQNGGTHNGKHNEETKLKISKKKKGQCMSIESKMKMSKSRVGDKHWTRNKKFTKEHLQHLSESHKGNPCWNKGKPRATWLSAEYEKQLKEKQRKAVLGNNYSGKKVRCVETKIVYESLSDAARKTNILVSNISRALKNKNYTAEKYHWEFVEKGCD